ncbi:MAG: MotA/TolQ/ExbB proton channel family protein [Gammaproteobacteria bacterium]
MLELIKAGGPLMWPLLLCSIISLAIIAERFWSLQTKRIAPKNLLAQVWQWQKAGHLDAKRLQQLRNNSPLGRILAAGLVNSRHEREVMKESIEEIGRHVVHEMERFLNTLGTIAAITPLLGLLGTVIGMIKVFAVITAEGVGNAAVLAEGISEALITTATGLTIAIPSLMFFRYFHGRVDEHVVTMEQEALKMVEIMHGQREQEQLPGVGN